MIDVLKTNLKLTGQGVRVRLPPFASAASFDKTNTLKSRVNKCWKQNQKNLKYVYFLTSTNTAAQICATKKAPELGALRRFVIGGGDGDANNG